jgi:hypothetical protein
LNSPSWLHLSLAYWLGAVGSLTQWSQGTEVCPRLSVLTEACRPRTHKSRGFLSYGTLTHPHISIKNKSENSSLQIFMQVSYICRNGPSGCLFMHQKGMSDFKMENFLNKKINYQLCNKGCNPRNWFMHCFYVCFIFALRQKTQSLYS